MGDRRFVLPYRRVDRAEDRGAELTRMDDESIIAALAYSGPDRDPLVANVLATEAMNRLRRTSAVVDNAMEGLVMVDPQGLVRAMNPAAEALLGWSEAELQGRPFHASVEHLDAAGKPTVEERSVILRIAREGGVARSIETTFADRWDVRIPVEVSVGGILREGEPDGAVVSFRDIRDRAAYRERLMQVLGVLAEGVLLVGVDGRVEYANEAAQRILSADMATLKAAAPYERTWIMSGPDGERPDPARLPAYRAIVLGEPTTDEELTLRRPGGGALIVSASAVPLRTSGRVTGAALSFHDITREREMARAQRDTEDRYRSLFEQNPLAVVSIDEAGNFIAVNSAAEKLSGYTQEEVRGKPFLPLLEEEDGERAMRRFGDVLAGARQEDDYTMVRRDGARVPVHVIGMPIVVGGSVVGMHAIIGPSP